MNNEKEPKAVAVMRNEEKKYKIYERYEGQLENMGNRNIPIQQSNAPAVTREEVKQEVETTLESNRGDFWLGVKRYRV